MNANIIDERSDETQVLAKVERDYITKNDFKTIMYPLVSYLEVLSQTYELSPDDDVKIKYVRNEILNRM